MSVQHQVGRGYGDIEKPTVEAEQPRKTEPGVKGMVSEQRRLRFPSAPRFLHCASPRS